ncbi:MAG: amino acid ABC transporter permease/ATP-binding protein [Immundisolibacterales bacterium]|nr:amino acid ABC transporter permease/ATP-binding protein [Immundisolibacterales bacterium]
MGWSWPVFLDALTSPFLLRAAWTTVWVAVVAQAIGTVIGVLVAPTMLSRNPLVSAPAWGYRWLFQGTPLLVQILAFYAVLPQLGVPLGVVASGLLALGLNEGARMAEIVRAGLMSVAPGQREAALSLGLRRWQVFAFIALPQAVKVIVPPLGNNFNYMLKATSLLAAISFAELLRTSQQMAQFTTRPLEVYSAATIYYLLMTSVWDAVQRRLEWWADPAKAARGQQLWERRQPQSVPGPAVEAFLARTVETSVAGSTPALVETCVLAKRFGSHEALAGVDFAVDPGEVVAIIGPSGCGKTTLLRCLNALASPDRGAVVMGGEPIGMRKGRRGGLEPLPTRAMNRQRREIGFVFQRFHLFGHLTALENVMLAPRLVLGQSRSQSRANARDLLARVGLADRADAFPNRLSGGQQQRVAIARALAMKPRLMLLDEPTSALDPETVHEVLGAIRALVEDGMTTVMVTHELGFAREVADRIVFMSEGRIVDEAPTGAFFEGGRDPRTQAFLARLI